MQRFGPEGSELVWAKCTHKEKEQRPWTALLRQTQKVGGYIVYMHNKFLDLFS